MKDCQSQIVGRDRIEVACIWTSYPLSDSKHMQPTGCLKAKPEALSASIFIFTNNGKDDLREMCLSNLQMVQAQS